MSIQSMTGYGSASFFVEQKQYEITIRSVNHRFLDLKFALPRFFESLETPISRVLKKRLVRGHIALTIRPVGTDSGLQEVVVDINTAKGIKESLLTLQKELELPDPPTLALLSGFREIFLFRESSHSPDEIKDTLLKTLHITLDSLQKMRGIEGESLCKDLLLRIETIKTLILKIEKKAPKSVQERHERILLRLQNLLSELSVTEIDPKVLEARVTLEIALIAEKTDVTEEITRLRAHIDQLVSRLHKGGPQGRRLDFLAQELHREANTIGAKCQDSDMLAFVVELKAEIEKIKEQVQNIE